MEQFLDEVSQAPIDPKNVRGPPESNRGACRPPNPSYIVSPATLETSRSSTTRLIHSTLSRGSATGIRAPPTNSVVVQASAGSTQVTQPFNHRPARSIIDLESPTGIPAPPTNAGVVQAPVGSILATQSSTHPPATSAPTKTTAKDRNAQKRKERINA